MATIPPAMPSTPATCKAALRPEAEAARISWRPSQLKNGDGRPAGEPVRIAPEDGPLLDALARDGRASYAALAKETGWTQGVVARRIELLRAAGVLYLDVDLATQLMGFATAAYLWLTVEPSRLASIGELIARHEEVPFASAITGTANLVAAVICRDTEALYRYVTTKISAASGVRQLEISPVLRRVKQAGTWMAASRLAALPSPA